MNKAKRGRRQIFILTLEEKKAVACMLAAFFLGLATKHYRAHILILLHRLPLAKNT